jgi:polar amino acid transport system permease protein
MSAADPPPALDQLDYKPHRRWYRRTEVVVPVLIVLFVYAWLILGIQETTRFGTRFRPDGGLSWDWPYFFHLIPLITRGMLVTAQATVLGFTVAAVGGLVLAMARRSRFRLVRWPVAFVIEFIRSTPLLVQLFFLLALVRTTGFIPAGASPLGLSRNVLILTLGLGIHYATYCSEAYRAGINSVPKGQWEAAIALNLDPVTKWTRIILPQAVPNVLPALGNYLVAGFKDAPMGFILPVAGVLFAANTIRSEDFRAQEPYILAGVAFLAVSIPAAWAVRRLERRISYERD